MAGTPEASRRKRKAEAVRKRRIGAPLYVIAGLPQRHALSVETQVRNVLGRSTGGEVFVPRITYRSWYSEHEADELFRLVANRVISDLETPGLAFSPSSVAVLYVPSSTDRQLDVLLKAFEFWAWPEPLMGLRAPTTPSRSHPPDELKEITQAILSAVRRIRASESAWMRVKAKLQLMKSAYLLPPENFHFPNEYSQLSEAYRQVLRGETGVLMPSLQRVPQGQQTLSGDRHFRDAFTRFFPPGKAQHGCLRELSGASRGDSVARRVWLNGAYRFGIWIGERQEHFDVQRAPGDVSPPDVYCARRQVWVPAARPHVNIFSNDYVRDGELFRS